MLSTLTVLALAAAAQAAPAANVIGPSDFSAEAIHISSLDPNYVRNGTSAMLQAYAKHHLTPTKEMPREFMNAIQKRQDGSAPARSAGGVEYLVSTTVGGQTLNLDFDSGSADLWVFSTELASSSTSGHNVYSSSSSSTFESLPGYTWDISYADGSGASGNVGTDTVTIGSTTVRGQAVELAQKVSSTFVQDASDGLVGLAFSSINTVRPESQYTFFDNAQQSLSNPLFAAYLPAGATGAYDFGNTVSSRYTGSITYTSVDSSGGFWEFPSTSYKVGSSTHSQSGFTGIADTGTTLILMSDDAVDTYYGSVSGAQYSSQQGGYIFDCSTSLPSLSFKIGDSYATIPGSLLNFASAGGSSCFGGLQSVGGGSQAIYGDVFFNAYYGVFDASGPSFGFAQAV